MKNNIYNDIKHERKRQHLIWGVQKHGPVLWHLILAEEFGEVGRAVNEWAFRSAPAERIREELIQTAAVCVAMLESLDRGDR